MSDDYEEYGDPPTCPVCDAPASTRCSGCGWVKPGAALPIHGIPEAIGVTEPLTHRPGEYMGIPREPEQAEPEPEPDPPIPVVLSELLCFLTGRAGTGKTYLARRMIHEWDGTILAATTGIAAANLGEGTTINALLGYYDTADFLEKYQSGRITTTLANLAASGVKRIVIDEVSMMDARQLTALTRAAEELSGDGYIVDQDLAKRLEGKGIDPVSIVLTGDFCQLPPVKAAYAFESEMWGKYAAHLHKLTVVRRQADAAFIAALNAAREGNAGPVCDFFRTRMVNQIDQNFDGTTILAKNEAVARFNQLRLDTLQEDVVTFQSARWGTERGDWKNIPPQFDLKIGALVMLLANTRQMGFDGRPGRIIYANGDLGHVRQIDVEKAEVWVELVRNGRTVQVEWITRVNVIPLAVGRKKALELEGRPDLVQDKFEVVGEVTYLPIRLAWATTVHKSQGLTLDTCQVDLREGFFQSPAMTYVALSRARSAEGLRLVGSEAILRKRCVIDAKVKPWL